MKMTKQSTELAAVVKPDFAVWDERLTEIEASLRSIVDTDGIYRVAACAMLESEELKKGLPDFGRGLDSAWKLLSALESLQEKESEDSRRQITQIVDFSSRKVADALKDGEARARHRARRDRIKGGQTRWADDPKQNEKTQIKAKWAEWQASPKLYASKTAFAKKMLDECTYLTSEKHITDLCRAWEKL